MWEEKYWMEMDYGHLREKNGAPARAMAAGRTTTGTVGEAGLGTQWVSMRNTGNCALSGYSSSSRNPPKFLRPLQQIIPTPAVLAGVHSPLSHRSLCVTQNKLQS